ncbi:pseudouridine synthase [Salinispirillum sp. LH 10-3-1]|uniref:tRNA pseudouridine synthase C n=1 Tax=Salinispirillum sp. LH 10-3-1 TaxID=2952525 RepID=A0AB38YFK9_9GAMM
MTADSSVILPPNPLKLLYQDEALLAVHKPSGLLVHRSPIDKHETQFALQYARTLNGGSHVYPLHRLDRPTSGLLLFARSPEIAGLMGEAMMERRLKKTYLAIVRGWPEAAGHIDYPLRDMADDPRYKGGELKMRDAITDFERLATVELPVAVDRYPSSRYALVRMHPHTGRKHQLRRHMKHLRHPIIGDAKHGKSTHNHFFAREFGVQRLMLAATRLELTHPVTEQPLTLNAPLAEDFQHVMRALGWSEWIEDQVFDAGKST